jgi:hypothetical protein
MNDITRKRILRKLENLPEEVLYEVIDFIDFVENRHGTGRVSPSPLQRLAEGVEDVMRVGKLPVSAIKGTMNVMDGAGKVVEGIASAGQTVFDEIQKATADVLPEVAPEKPSASDEGEQDADSEKGGAGNA